MVPKDVALQDFARARVMYVRPLGILNRRRDVANDGIAYIFRTPIRVLFFTGWIFGDNSVFETGLLKCALPVLYALFEPGTPGFWGIAGSI